MRLIETLPRWIAALATLWLGIFAFMAWKESIRTTGALQGQLKAMQIDQRPLMWVVDARPSPVYDDPSGQIRWNVAFANLGKGVAYSVVLRVYIKIGNERYQSGRGLGINSVELNPPEPTIIPPGVPFREWTTISSRPGINKEFFAKMLNTDLALGVLVEFDYADASGENSFTDAVCIERFASGAIANVPPKNCEK